MPWLGAKVHGQIVLQGHMHRTEVIVYPHIRQRGHIGCWDRAHVQGEVVKHRPDRWQGEGWVHKGIGRHLWWVQVLWDRPWKGFHPLYLLRGLLQRRSNAFEGVL